MQRTADRQDFKKIAIAVVSPTDSGLLRTLASHELLQVDHVSQEEALASLRAQKVVAILQVPSGFETEIQAGSFPVLHLDLDDSKATSVSLLREIIRSGCRDLASQEFPADIRVTHQPHSQGPQAQRARLGGLWMLMGCLSALTLAASSLSEEKEGGCLRQMLLTPASKAQLLGSKIAASATLAAISGLLVLQFSHLQSPNWVGASALLILGALSFASLGALIGAQTSGSVSSNAWSGALFLVLILPVTLRETSLTMSTLSLFSPAYYLQEGITHALLGTDGSAGFPNQSVLWALTGFGAVFAALAQSALTRWQYR